MLLLRQAAFRYGLCPNSRAASRITEVLQAIATIIDRLQGGIRTRARRA